jgi:tRNA (guanine-N7-)-methyltransferase
MPEFFNPFGEGYAQGISWRPPTKFEKKGLDKNHQIREIYFIKSK